MYGMIFSSCLAVCYEYPKVPRLLKDIELLLVYDNELIVNVS